MVLVAAAACVGAMLFAAHVSRPTGLESCTPCTSGPGCVAGCLPPEMADARMQQLVQTKQVQPAGPQMHTSLHDQASAIERKNEALLQMSQGQRSEGLGGVLDAAVKQVLRAEAAEVKLRRQAELSKGASVGSVYKSLGPADKELFKLRAREYELALKEVDKDLIVASNVMAPLTPAVAPHKAEPALEAPVARQQKLAQQKPSWTSAMSNLLSSEFTDGHGAAWGVGKKAVREQAHARSEFRKGKLPGVEMNNWELTKGRLAMRPKGDDPRLPGVRTHGW